MVNKWEKEGAEIVKKFFFYKKDGPEMVKSSEKGKRGHEMFKSY